MYRACPDCGRRRDLSSGHPVVARCACGQVWCWLCRRTVDLKSAIATTEATQSEQLAGMTPAALTALDRSRPEAYEAAAAAVHTLGPRRWRGGLPALITNLTSARPAKGPCGATACPAYLELVEHAGAFPEHLDSETLGGAENRDAWLQMCWHETESGQPVEPTVSLRREAARP
jgi:hypothetical protein